MKHFMCISLFLLTITAVVSAQNSFFPGQGPVVLTEPGTALASWNADTHNFGEVAQGVPVSHRFEFTNTGDKALTIDNVKVGCGCTAYEYSKEEILPGEQGFVTATYNAKKIGHFTKTVTVFTNEEAGQQRLILKGEVVGSEK